MRTYHTCIAERVSAMENQSERLLLALIAAIFWKPHDLSNSQLEKLIDEWLHSERDRNVMKRHMIDGICVEALSEEIDRTPRQTARIIKKAKSELSKHI